MGKYATVCPACVLLGRERRGWVCRMASRSVWFATALAVVLCGGARGQVGSPNEVVATLVAHERSAAEHKGLYEYVSKERSDRTGGHEWTERVVETRSGKVRRLLAEDGTPLGGERLTQERGRLAAIAADPAAFAKREQAGKDDEARARQMLDLLPRAFVFENARMEGEYERIDYRPNAAYQPQSLEERVLHGMSGSMLVEPKAVRLHRLEGRLPEDVSLGFGLLATIHAGSRFATERAATDSGEWKTRLIDTDINGRAIFFKAISRRQHTERGEFREIAGDTSVAQAVTLAER